MIKEFGNLKFIEPCYNIDDLEKSLLNIENKKYSKYVSNTAIIESIENFIDN